MKTIKTGQVTETSIFSELERICRIITDQKIDNQDMIFFREHIKTGLTRIDTLREAKAKKEEIQKEQRTLKKLLDEIDKEISRLGLISGTNGMISRMQQEKERCLMQMQELKGVKK